MTSDHHQQALSRAAELRQWRLCLWPAGPAHCRRRGGHAARTASPRQAARCRGVDDGSWELRDGATILAIGRGASVELARLEKASFEEASAAERLTPVKPHEHPLPTCFVCGPARTKATACAFLPDRSRVNPKTVLRCWRRPGYRIRRLSRRTAWSRRNFSGRRSIVPRAMLPITTPKAAAPSERRSCWAGCRHGSRRGRARESAASSPRGKPAATAANALPRPQPLAKRTIAGGRARDVDCRRAQCAARPRLNVFLHV